MADDEGRHRAGPALEGAQGATTVGYDFANILFAGPCNRACPWCIGQQLPASANVDNLDVFPPRGLDALIDAVNAHRVPEVILTGTVSDPSLYRHEGRLLDVLRARLHPGARLSLHTNGVLALRKIETLNRYDRVCLSFPSFVPATYAAMMGSPRVPDLGAILAAARIPVKVSCVVDAPNRGEIGAFVAECARLGVRRLVLRPLFGATLPDEVTALFPAEPARRFQGNPVYQVGALEVTLWDWRRATLRSLNLFPDGTLGTEYLLTETRALGRRAALP